MRKVNTKSFVNFFLSMIFLFFAYCEKDPTPSIFVENPESNPDPVITSMVPAGKTLAGIGEIIFNGQNFSPVIEENTVFFDGTPAKILAATTTQLTVQSPNLPGDSLEVKINVVGSFLFSNTMYYSLENAVEEYGGYNDFDDVWGICVDAGENLFTSLRARRVDKITPDGEREDNWATTIGVIQANHMKVGPGGYIYLTRKNSTLYRIPPGGGNSETFVSSLPTKIYDLDFDPTGNIYTAGDGDNITLIHPDATFKVVADYLDTFIKAVRVFNGYVYVAGNESDTKEAVWRNQIISADSLGNNEIVFDLTTQLGADIEIQSLEFAEDGDMYIGTTDTLAVILIVHSDGSHEPLYPGVLEPQTYDMHWGNSVHLYVNRRNSDVTKKRIIKVNMQKNGAPYYGRQL